MMIGKQYTSDSVRESFTNHRFYPAKSKLGDRYIQSAIAFCVASDEAVCNSFHFVGDLSVLQKATRFTNAHLPLITTYQP